MTNIQNSIGGSLVAVEGHCDVHGAYTGMSIRGRPAQCRECRELRENAERAEQQERERAARHEATLDAMRLRGRFRDATFESFEATSAEQQGVQAACRNFADDFDESQGHGLWLIGGVGTGKTHLGCAIAQAVQFQRQRGAIVMTVRELIRYLRDTWRSGSTRTEGDAIGILGGIPLLVLDELGTSFGTDAELTQLFDVVDARYQLRRPTVVISNLNGTLVREAIGDRLYDRLREGATVLPCDWGSYRTPRAKTRERVDRLLLQRDAHLRPTTMKGNP
jgi:DNA replication protein DnaC